MGRCDTERAGADLDTLVAAEERRGRAGAGEPDHAGAGNRVR
ncbi:hypothetical protein JD77_03362 [Micromonospora olivasterospora]|uniref:Uncharacterized protein n=1 Tax=Micromonospora olivasterospora TaxID=1880 RepID=A0A562IBL8_MICOL|nr:hypothetical protein JD77_03362 [Micromonospora olivasterospora]